MNKVRMQDLTWVEVEERMRADVTVLVPFGSQEQHGPHAPMGDFMICEAIAVAVAERTGSIVAPVIAGGYSEYFKPYPGTISLRSSTLGALLGDYVDCLVGQGFGRIIFFNGHNGNLGTIDHTVRKIRVEKGIRIPSLNVIGFRTPELMKELFPVGGLGHGGAAMMALFQHLDPTAGRPDLAAAGKMHDFHGLKVTGINTVDFKGFPVNIHFNYDEITDPSGIVGDGRESSPEKGKRWFDLIVENASAFVEWSKGVSWKV
ncbi:MAG TPA: creatininase family protein [Candidatus Limnocylindria bacterium]|nr:creatininase family protein [Candidatus Limnocylindria bacterium]